MTQKDANYMIKKLDDIDPSNEDPSIRNEINAIKDIFRGIKKNLKVIESKPNDNKIKNNKNEFDKNNKTIELKSISNEDEDFYKTNKPRINSKTKKKSKKRKNSRNSEQYMDKKICIEGCIGCNIV